MLKPFAPTIYVAEGPTVPFLGIPYPTRMAIVKLEDGGLWIWSPIALSPELEREVADLGPVRHIVAPNKLHHLFLTEWAERFPEAHIYAPPGLAKRRPAIPFDNELGDEAPAAWAGEIDQCIFRGSLAMDEVLFFHRNSRTALVCDLIQRHDASRFNPIHRGLMRVLGIMGQEGSTTREWRLTFLRRRQTRTSRAVVLNWKAENLLIAHGACAKGQAETILARALAWA